MERHWKGIVAFLAIAIIGFVVAMFTESYFFAIGAVLVTTFGLGVYLLAVSNVQRKVDHGQHHM